MCFKETESYANSSVTTRKVIMLHKPQWKGQTKHIPKGVNPDIKYWYSRLGAMRRDKTTPSCKTLLSESPLRGRHGQGTGQRVIGRRIRSSPNGSSVITIKLNTKEHFNIANMLFYTPQKYYLNKVAHSCKTYYCIPYKDP